MIAPCKCIGSVKYIHKECLRRWVIEDDKVNQDRIICNICRVSLYNLEIIPPKQILDRLLYSITSVCIFIHYLSFVFWRTKSMFFNPFEVLQISMQAYYIFLYVQQFKVKNHLIYIELTFNRGSYILLFIYLYCIVSFFSGRHISMALASNFTFILHWNEHSLILAAINDHLIKN